MGGGVERISIPLRDREEGARFCVRHFMVPGSGGGIVAGEDPPSTQGHE